jgi:hypothetical protein
MHRNIHVMGNHILDLEQTEFVMIYERRLVATKKISAGEASSYVSVSASGGRQVLRTEF